MKKNILKTDDKEMNYGSLIEAVARAHEQAQRQATQAVNLALTLRNWLIGYHIFEYQQNGKTARLTAKSCSTICQGICESVWAKVSPAEICLCFVNFMCVIQLCNQ
jgi:hypothetical protein